MFVKRYFLLEILPPVKNFGFGKARTALKISFVAYTNTRDEWRTLTASYLFDECFTLASLQRMTLIRHLKQ